MTSSLTPITPNPGGQLTIQEIIGRDKLIDEVWGVLRGQSVYMNDHRRIGKTQIMVKMHAEPQAGWHTIKRDLESCHTAVDFAACVFQDASQVLSRKKRMLRSTKALLSQLGGTEVGGILTFPSGTPLPWKNMLEQTFADIEQEMISLEEEAKFPQRMVFLWDEIPFLLDNISRRESPDVAMEVLDALRAFSQDHDHIRLVLTGSIGIHHVLSALRKSGYGNDPLNRMHHIQPGPLAADDARMLASRLLIGAGFDSEKINIIECSTVIAALVGNVAFYIHKLISRLPKKQPLTSEIIEQQLKAEISSLERNDWNLSHYADRLVKYYGDDVSIVRLILDHVAIKNADANFDSMRRAVTGSMNFHDDEKLRSLIRLLCQDFYLKREQDGSYRFHLELIRRWWCVYRELSN
ncbi:hypothetical protein [Ereboglobus luteus]|uniref:hypothetical protein n=1 Tax=Ereboglobus luteus TaxID=1796921 RepID=UPI00126030D2|nr:hypothetical protein [Ereboglobus luteus]